MVLGSMLKSTSWGFGLVGLHAGIMPMEIRPYSNKTPLRENIRNMRIFNVD